MAAIDTIVFLHGFPLGPAMWRFQKESLEAEGYRVLTPDLRIEGQASGDGLPAPVTMEQMADRVIGEMDTAGAARAVIAGFSMGGYVAFTILDKYPDRMAGLILADTKAGPDTEEGKAGRRTMARNVMAEGSRAAAASMLGKLLSPKTLHRKPDLVREAERIMLEASPEAVASAALGMAERPDRTPMLAVIRIPTLVIVGEDDAITPPETARKMASSIPGAKLELIPDAGHLANMEQPESFNRAISSWLALQGNER